MAEQIDDDDVLEVGSDDGDSGKTGLSGKLAGIKKLLSNKIILISIISVLIILLAGGVYLLFFSDNDKPAEPESLELSEEVPAEPESLDLNQEIPAEQEMTSPSESGTDSSDELSPASEQPTSDNSEQTVNSDNMDGDTPSKLSQISKGMVEAAKNGGIPTTVDVTTDTATELPPESPESPESQLLSTLLTEKITELESENQKLKEHISNLELQIKLYKNAKRVEDLSVPIDKLGTGTITGTDLYNDGLVNDFSNDYSASPYADDDMTPKPTWGDAKPKINK